MKRARFAQLPSISFDLLEHHSTSYGPHLEYLLRLNLPQCARSSAQSPPISLDLLGAGVNMSRGSGSSRCCQRKRSQVSPPISIPKNRHRMASGVGKASTEKVAGYDHSLTRR